MATAVAKEDDVLYGTALCCTHLCCTHLCAVLYSALCCSILYHSGRDCKDRLPLSPLVERLTSVYHSGRKHKARFLVFSPRVVLLLHSSLLIYHVLFFVRWYMLVCFCTAVSTVRRRYIVEKRNTRSLSQSLLDGLKGMVQRVLEGDSPVDLSRVCRTTSG